MSTRWGAVGLLALLIPLAAVVMDGDRWPVGPAGLSGDAGGLIGLAAEAATTSALGLVPPPLHSRATAAWTGLTSTDRAPPGSTPSFA